MRSRFCFLYTAQFCPATSLQIPSLYLEIRFFLDDMSVLVQPPNRSSKASLPWLMDCGQLEVETAAARCKTGGALPEKRDTQVSVEIFVLKSQFFGTKQHIAAPICQYSINCPLLK